MVLQTRFRNCRANWSGGAPYQVLFQLEPPKKPNCDCCATRSCGCCAVCIGRAGRLLAILRLRWTCGSGFASAGTNWAKVSRARAWALESVALAPAEAGAGGATARAAMTGAGTIVGRLVS